MHAKGIAHRDLKPENIMLDSQLNLKLIDFGLTNRINDEEQDIHLLSTFAGTPQFQAPEIFNKQKYDGKQADMFSMGVILFMIVSKSYPFRMAEQNEKYYKFIYRNTPEDFVKYWKRMGDRFSKKGIKAELITEEFKALIFRLLCYEPKNRMTIEELEKDPWFNSVDYSRNRTRKELAFSYM
jgi:carbon catabolite-derepressing protein kinase